MVTGVALQVLIGLFVGDNESNYHFKRMYTTVIHVLVFG